jgi:hypothetical protein
MHLGSTQKWALHSDREGTPDSDDPGDDNRFRYSVWDSAAFQGVWVRSEPAAGIKDPAIDTGFAAFVTVGTSQKPKELKMMREGRPRDDRL